MENKINNVEKGFNYLIQKSWSIEKTKNEIYKILWFETMLAELMYKGFKFNNTNLTNNELFKNFMKEKNISYEKIVEIKNLIIHYVTLTFKSKGLRNENHDFCKYISQILFDINDIKNRITSL